VSASPLLIAYPGDYHDAVVQALRDYFAQYGGTVITGVTLNAINGTTAIADVINLILLIKSHFLLLMCKFLCNLTAA
jgi:hypothetical protein